MKKLLALLLALMMVAGLAACGETAPAATEAPAETAPADTENGEAPAEISVPALDYEKLYALHDKDEVVLTVDGEEITWDEYFSWYRMNASQVENYFAGMAAYYNAEVGWEDQFDDEHSFNEYVPIITESSVAQLVAIENVAAKKGYIKGDEFNKAVEEQKQGDIVTVCGEGATEEEFFAKLAEGYMCRKSYERMNSSNAVYSLAFLDIYGEKLEKIKADDAVKFLEDNGQMRATHILFLNTNEAGERLDDAALREKKSQLEEIRAELANIKDNEKLVTRFAELKAEWCDDTGKAVYPDGYFFTTGQMVPEFENAYNSLKDYELSDVFETSYGYHIMLRLPLDADATMGYNNDGTPYNGRVLYADNDFNGAIQEEMLAVKISYADGFTAPKASDFVK